MDYRLQDGRIVQVPEGLTAAERLRYVEVYHDKPHLGERILGNLQAGAGGMAQQVGNVLAFGGVEGAAQRGTDIYKAFANFPSAQKVMAQPAESWLGRLGEGLVRFLPELPLYAAGEGAIMGGLKAVPKLAGVARALTAVKGEGILPSTLKAATRAGGAGALVGTLGAPPESTPIERAKHGAGEAVGFAAAVGTLHPAFKLLGLMGGGIARRFKNRVLDADAQLEIKAKAEARREVEPGIDRYLKEWEDIGYQEKILPEELHFKGLGDAELQEHLGYLDDQFRTAKGVQAERISEEATQIELELEARDAARAQKILETPRAPVEPTIADRRRYVQKLNRPPTFEELDKETQELLGSFFDKPLDPKKVIGPKELLRLRARIYEQAYTPENRAKLLAQAEFYERMSKKFPYKIPKADMEPSIQNLVKELKLNKKEEQVLRTIIGELKEYPGFQLVPLEEGLEGVPLKEGAFWGKYNFADNLLSLSRISSAGHEMGHFAFYHLLSAGERLEYLRTMMDKVDAGYNMKEKLAVPDNGADNFSEFFASQWQQYLYSHRIPDSMHKSLVAKTIEFFEKVMMRLFKKDLVDQDLVKFFEPHLKDRAVREQVAKAKTLPARLEEAKEKSKTELDEEKWLREQAPLSGALRKRGYSLKELESKSLEEKETLLKDIQEREKATAERTLTEEELAIVAEQETKIQDYLRERRAKAEERGRRVEDELEEELVLLPEDDVEGAGDIAEAIEALAKEVLEPEELARIEERARIAEALRERLERKKPARRRRAAKAEAEPKEELTAEDFLGKDKVEEEFGLREVDLEDPTAYVNAAGEVMYLDEVLSKVGVGYRAGGPRDFAESFKRLDAGRDTGYFGSGTYLFSTKEKAARYGESTGRDVSEVSLAGKNLFKPNNNHQADLLHTALREVNQMVWSKEPYEFLRNPEFISQRLNRAGVKITPNEIDVIIKEGKRDVDAYTSSFRAPADLDSIPTRIMKKAGYDGVDVRHLPDYDTGVYGTVVYKPSKTEVFSKPETTKEKVIRLPKHYNEDFIAWAEEQGISVKTKAETVAAWEQYVDSIKVFEEAKPKTTLGRTYKAALGKLWNAGAKENPSTKILESVQGEGGTQVLLMNTEKDIMPMVDYIWSPMFWAKKIPGLEKIAFNLTQGQMRSRYATMEHATTIRSISDVLSKEDRLRVRDIMEGKEEAKTPEQAEAAAKMRDWFDHMRGKFKDYLRGIYKQELSDNQFQALSAMINGATAKETAAKYNLDTKVLESILKEYKDIDNWGLDQYVSRVERGSMRLLTEEGRLIGYVLSPKHAREKWREFAKTHPDVKNVVLDVKHPHESLMELRKGEYHAVNAEIEKELRSYMKAINKELAEEVISGRKGPTVTPTLKFSAFAEKRKGRLKGERDIFNLAIAYARTMESKMHLDPAILEARKILPSLPPNAKKALTRLIEDTKGKYGAGDRIVDWMLGKIEAKSGGAVAFKKQAYTRAVGAAKTGEAWTKFAYRPIAGMINYASGLAHIWIKTSASAIREGQAFLKTPEGRAFIQEVKPDLGVDMVEYMTGAGELKFATKVGRRKQSAGGITGFLKDVTHPMGFFQAPEGPLRELSAATNYLLAKSKGASEAAARESAIRAVWFQEFTYNTSALPTWMRGPTGRLVGQFKPYLVKELEFISSLRGAEIAKYMAMQTVLGGPRGFMYVLRSLPLLSMVIPLTVWNEIDEFLDTQAPRLSRGVGGYLGVDVTAPAVFQFPTRFEDWMGPFLSDLMRLKKDVVDPILRGESYGQDKPFLSPWTSAPSEITEWTAGTVPILRHWNMMFEQMVDKDGWVKNERGQRMFYIGDGAMDQLAMTLRGVAGAGSLEQSLVRGAQRRLRQERKVRSANKSKLADMIVDQLSRGEELSDETIQEMVELNVTSATLRRNWKMRQLDPMTREFIKSELAKRAEVLEGWTEFEGRPVGSSF